MYHAKVVSAYIWCKKPVKKPLKPRAIKKNTNLYLTLQQPGIALLFMIKFLKTNVITTHRIHVWYIYLHEWLIFMVNEGKYTSPMDMGYIPVGCPPFPGFQDSCREG